ncbi:MAG: cytochrome c3 family protein [Candidatus Eisenbacteria bacterium]
MKRNSIDSRSLVRRVLIGSCVLALTVAGALFCANRGVAAKPDSIKEMHDIHRANDLPCAACHENAATSKSGTDNLLPTMEACKECHDVADQNHCGDCHTNIEAAAASPRHVESVQKFPHETHVKAGMKCETCHGAKGEPKVPSMELCRTCHETASAQADCGTCHATLEPLKPESHEGDWLSAHAVEAQANNGGQAACANCHAEKDCQDCHSGDNVRPRVHPLGFNFEHAIAARGNSLDCATCHEAASFCAPCHRDQQVLPMNHSRANWLLPGDGGMHAEEGELDLESCIACHDLGAAPANCVECHAKEEP